MSSSNRRTGKKDTKQLSVATRCVAIVFKKTDTEKVVDENGTELDEKLHVELLHAEYHEKDKRDTADVCGGSFNAKEVLDEFKLRNRTCYWNPALVDSIKSLEYVGFIEPLTVLVKGDDIHLENIRTAWGRRVLKDPAYYTIDRIGDVNGIEMQVVPQTQFIPLPEALCLVIMDLNNRQILATLETVCEKLKDCYHGLNLPSNQLVYETLGSLIRERKVFHTGCGYFVVTPDTFRFNGADPQSTMFAPWTHLHPMYIPAAFGQPFRQPTRSISCQVDAEDNLIGQAESCDKSDRQSNKDKTKDAPNMRRQRSMSFSVRRSRDKNRKEEEVQYGSIKRSSSVSGRNEKENKPQTTDSISEPGVKGEKLKKEKVSIFSKLFGRNKKKAAVPEPKKPAVEYASFSAQFPPPEWMWYQQQLDKQVRTETWVQQQIVKSGTWHYLNSLPSEFGPGSFIMGTSSAPDRSSPLVNKNNEKVNHDFIPGTNGRSHKKSHRNKPGRTPLVIVNSPPQAGSPLDYGDYQTHRNSMGQPSLRLSSLPTRVSQPTDTTHSNFTSHPLFSSTPRVGTIPERLKPPDVDHHQTEGSKHKKNDKVKSKKTPKSRKSKSHPDRHSHHDPNFRHISGMSEKPNLPYSTQQDDISMQYHGQMPEKFSSLGQSRSSGVNCMDLEHDEGHLRSSQRSHRSRSYRQSLSDYDHRVRGHYEGEGMEMLYENTNTCQVARRETYRRQSDSINAHIYANVHISNNDEVKPKLPERNRRKPQKDRSNDCKGEETLLKQTASDNDRFGYHGDRYDRLGHHKRDGYCDSKQDRQTHYREHDRLEHGDRKHDRHGYHDRQVDHEGHDILDHHESDYFRHEREHGRLASHNRLVVDERDVDRQSEGNSEQGTEQSSSSQEHSSQDSAVDGTESSEHSLGTVINTQSLVNKHLDKLSTRTEELSLGDSGFNSPRVSEHCHEHKKEEFGFKKEQVFMCNNLKMEKNAMNNSLGKLDECSDDSVSCIRSDTLYENAKLNQSEVLNNMKYLHKEINVSSQNLNLTPGQENGTGNGDFDPKQPVVKKFNFEGDFHVVGVV